MTTRRKKPTSEIYLAEEQMQEIEGLIDSALLSNGKTPEFIARLRTLKGELDKARIVPLEKLPPDVVRLGSWIEIEDPADGFVDQFQLVYPDFADLSRGKISLMTPMGIALMGEQVGREVTYRAPSGAQTIRIRRVSSEPFEPEKLEESAPQAGIE